MRWRGGREGGMRRRRLIGREEGRKGGQERREDSATEPQTHIKENHEGEYLRKKNRIDTRDRK